MTDLHYNVHSHGLRFIEPSLVLVRVGVTPSLGGKGWTERHVRKGHGLDPQEVREAVTAALQKSPLEGA